MNILWNSAPLQLINFDFMQDARESSNYLIINVLPCHDQDCLISGTIAASNEEQILNEMIQSITVPNKKLILYGKNCNDEAVTEKTIQLKKLGLCDVFIYRGGLFEWMLLQDIYGEKEFPTTKRDVDILRFKPTTSIYK
jgi:hypothetical protein